MKKVLIKYGGFAAATMVVLFLISFLFIEREGVDFATQEIFGYLSIVASLVFVFFGVKSYRDDHSNGSISFGKALWVGILIALIPSILFGIYNVLYVEVINPEFYDQYYAAMVADAMANLSGADLDAKLKEIADMKALAMSPVFTFALMAFTVLIVGFIISLLSALVLRKKNVATA